MTSIDVLALTLWGEGRGEPVEGRIGIACVIRNRVFADLGHDGRPDWWGEGYQGVCLKPSQFSCWNTDDPNRPKLDALIAGGLTKDQIGANPELAECYWIAQGIVDGQVLPRVGPATHYYATSMPAPPAWAGRARLIARLGHHLFVDGVP